MAVLAQPGCRVVTVKSKSRFSLVSANKDLGFEASFGFVGGGGVWWWLRDCLKRRLISVVTRHATRTVVGCQAGSGAEVVEQDGDSISVALPLMLHMFQADNKRLFARSLRQE